MAMKSTISGTLDLKTLDLGNRGVLRIHQGRLTLDGPEGLTAASEGGSVHLDRSGYLILNGLTGKPPIDLLVRSGRLENRGSVDAGAKLRIEASGGELRLAGSGNSMRLGNGSELKLVGQSARAGYFGDTSGTISFEDGGMLSFVCDENGVSTLGEMDGEELDSTLAIVGDQCARSRFVTTAVAAGRTSALAREGRPDRRPVWPRKIRRCPECRDRRSQDCA